MRRIMLFLLVFTLTACGGKDSDKKATQTPPPDDLAPATPSPVIVDLQRDLGQSRREPDGAVWELSRCAQPRGHFRRRRSGLPAAGRFAAERR
jgi:hypothetical protein